MIDVGIAPAAAAKDPALVHELVGLVNRVYAVAEEGLWADGAPRTTPAEMAELIAAGQIAVARAGERIVGAVRLRRLDTGEGEFGMLVADSAHRGTGVGRELVRFAERWSREQSLDTTQLEVLVPRRWAHPSKEFLKAWYTRAGYRPVRTGQFEESYPELAPLLVTPCDFVIYHKNLLPERCVPPEAGRSAEPAPPPARAAVQAPLAQTPRCIAPGGRHAALDHADPGPRRPGRLSLRRRQP
jgi:GNAT superfamily N-acetyltransferase